MIRILGFLLCSLSAAFFVHGGDYGPATFMALVAIDLSNRREER